MKRLGSFLLALAVAYAAFSGVQAHEPLPPERAPHLVVDVSGSLIAAAVRQSVDRTEPFRQLILESQVTGMQRTIGKVRGELFPDPCRGSFFVILRGDSYSHGVGRQDCLVTHTDSVATFEVGHLVTIDGKGLATTPGPLNADARVCFLGATNPFGDPDTFAAQMAPSGFRKQQREIESIVAGTTSKQASQRLAEELTSPLTAGSNAMAQALTFAKEAGWAADSLRFSTSITHVQARARLAAIDGKEPGPAPPLAGNVDLGLRVHEAALNQTARTMLGGRTLRLNELTGLSGQLSNLLFRDDRKDAAKDGLKTLEKLIASLSERQPTVTFAKSDPITVRFTAEGLTIQGHLSKIVLDGQPFAGFRVSARYRLENKNGGAFIIRQGPLEFLPSTEPTKLKPLDAPSRVLVEAVAEEILKSRLALAELAMPAQLARLGPLTPARVEAGNGWIMAGWKLRTP